MLSVLIAAALSAASPNASAADDAACVTDQTSAEDSAWVGERVLAGQDLGNSEQLERLGGYVQACIQRLGWDEERAVRASTLSISQMGRTSALRRLSAAGIDHAALDRWFAAQSEEFRTRAFVEMRDDEATAIVETLAPAALSPELFERHSELVGGYLASLVIAIRVERGLPIE
jgi:hypothetical protein